MITDRDRFVPMNPDTDRMTTKDDIRDRAARVADLVLTRLSRPRPQENSNMASGYFIGGDGKRRTFNSDGTETTPGAQPATQRPTPGSSTPNLARPVAAASPQPPTPQPGAQGTFSVMPPGTSSPMLHCCTEQYFL